MYILLFSCKHVQKRFQRHSYDMTNFIYEDRRNNNDDVGNKMVDTFCCYADNNEENVN